ncbi:CatB-related O-acetyltransferase [Macrococcus capreoli]|uniref:CatB-related O-acetyltransferase n=1 Tax=Macrococcus capreoli TaxID=2982690 RepID=UPI003F432D23
MSRVKKFTNSLINRKNLKKTNIKISPLAFCDEKTKLDTNVYIDRFCVIHNSRISSYTYLGYGCKLNNVTIGRYCSLASDIKIGLGKHPTNLFSTSPIFYSDKNPFGIKLKRKLNFDDSSLETTIGNDVWIGANVIIMDGVNIGDGAIIGAGSIVTKDIPPYEIHVGAPAKKIKDRFSIEMKEEIINTQWWKLEAEEVMNTDIY